MPRIGDSRAGSLMRAIDRDLLGFAGNRRFATILADPPWRFVNKTGKVAPEHRRLSRYGTMTLDAAAAPAGIRRAMTSRYTANWKHGYAPAQQPRRPRHRNARSPLYQSRSTARHGAARARARARRVRL